MKAIYNNQKMNIIGMKTVKEDYQIKLFYKLETLDKTKIFIVPEKDSHLNFYV